jgi:hypothetical protein
MTGKATFNDGADTGPDPLEIVPTPFQMAGIAGSVPCPSLVAAALGAQTVERDV